MYGHGTSNCQRRSSCNLCASIEHNQTNCPLSKLPSDSAPAFKCSYCISHKYQHANHKANDPNCPARKAYLDVRKNIATRQENKHSNKPTQNHQKFSDSAPTPPEMSSPAKTISPTQQPTALMRICFQQRNCCEYLRVQFIKLGIVEQNWIKSK